MIEFAYAATSGTANPSGGGMSILMIVLMVAIFYFMLIRPESKRKKQAEEMRSSLQKGDWLTTIGGVYGRLCGHPGRAGRCCSARQPQVQEGREACRDPCRDPRGGDSRRN